MKMKCTSTLFVVFFYNVIVLGQSRQQDSIFISNIYSEILINGTCHEELRFLCKNIGHRVAGSPSAQKAIEWGKSELKKLGADTSYLMPVEVPHWSRGKKEWGKVYLNNKKEEIPIVALGGSVGGQIKGAVIEVKSIKEMQDLGVEKIKGKIVFINKPLDAALINTGAAYGGGGEIRRRGPAEAEKLGAIGCVIRSLTLADDQFPHTGAMDPAGIPSAALSSYHSKWLSDHLKTNQDLALEIHLDCINSERVIQANVIGEIKGSEFPNEIITIGGHLDSWDVGEGAHDDGTGCVQSMEVLRTLVAMGYKPKRTIRVVLFINEEFGNDGGITYAKKTVENGDRHLAAIESDGGGFTPRGFSSQSPDARFNQFMEWSTLFEPYQLHSFKRGWSGVDIGPLKNDEVALFALNVDNQRYFDYHHTHNDVFENVNKRELQLGAAAMTSLVYLIDQHFSKLP
jgi:carboxypeptidase Q